MKECLCGNVMSDTASCLACSDPERYDDHICEGLCDSCWEAAE